MAISHFCWQLVVNNGKFTFLLTSSGQQCQFPISTDIWWSRMAILHFLWHLVVENGFCNVTCLSEDNTNWCLYSYLLLAFMLLQYICPYCMCVIYIKMIVVHPVVHPVGQCTGYGMVTWVIPLIGYVHTDVYYNNWYTLCPPPSNKNKQ